MKQPSGLLVLELLLCLPTLANSLPATDILQRVPTQFDVRALQQQDRNLQQDAAARCNQEKDALLALDSNEVYQWSCACNEVTNELDATSDNTYHLTCYAGCGHFCNVEETVCLTPGIISGFDSNGVNYLFSQTYLYTRGREEFVDRRVFFNADSSPLSCQYTVGGVDCQQCDIITCTGAGSPISLQCENVEAGATFDFCVDPTPEVDTGVFQFLNDNDFRTCYELEAPPVMTPTPTTPAPTDNPPPVMAPTPTTPAPTDNPPPVMAPTPTTPAPTDNPTSPAPTDSPTMPDGSGSSTSTSSWLLLAFGIQLVGFLILPNVFGV
jgi:hypothetical protein